MEHMSVTPKAALAYLAAMLAMVGLLLTWNMNERYREFEAHQAKLVASSVSGAAGELAVSLHELRRSVHLFAGSHAELIEALAAHPDDTPLHDRLDQAVHAYFPEAFAFTIADKTGTPLIEDFDGLVGEVCQKDLRQFATDRVHSRIYIHPHTEVYHYDIMVDWDKNSAAQGIFFVSFKADTLARMLKNSQIPGHKLMLLNNDIPGLIEVTDSGARIVLKRDFKLTPEEMHRIAYSLAVQGTSWNLADLPDAGLLAEARRGMRNEALFIFLAFACAAGIMAAILHITYRRSMKLEYTCMHDAATGLPNRYFLLDRLQMLISQAQRESRQFALLLIDTGNARGHNQTFFDRTDTALLKQAGERIRSQLPAGDLLARLSGTEFAALLSNTNSETAMRIAQAIKNTLRQMDSGVAWPQPSAGYVVFPDEGKDFEALIQRANLALYADRRWNTLKPGQAAD